MWFIFTRKNSLVILIAVLICSLWASPAPAKKKTREQQNKEDFEEFKGDWFTAKEKRKDPAEAFRFFDSYLDEHLFDSKLLKAVIEFMEAGEVEKIAGIWKKYYVVDLSQFLTGTKVDLNILIKARHSNRKKEIHQRLLNLLTEEGDLLRMAQAIELAGSMDLQLDKNLWIKQFSKVCVALDSPVLKQWALTGPYSKYLSEEDKKDIKKNLLRGQVTYRVPPAPRGNRPSRRAFWASAGWHNESKPEKKVSRTSRFNIYPNMYKNKIEPKRGHQLIKHVIDIAGKNKKLRYLDIKTGALRYREVFSERSQSTLISYDSFEGEKDQLDVLGWMRMGGIESGFRTRSRSFGFSCETDLIMRYADGRPKWKRLLSDLMEVEEKMFLAGKVLRDRDRIYLPVFVSSASISGFSRVDLENALYVFCISAEDASVIWRREVDLKGTSSSRMPIMANLQLLSAEGVLWLNGGEGSLMALDKISGFALFTEKLAGPTRHRSITSRKRMGQAIFQKVGTYLLNRGQGEDYCRLLEAHTGRTIVSFACRGLVFLEQNEDGLLFFDAGGFILLPSTKKDRFENTGQKVKLFSLQLPGLIDDVVPWGKGCLMRSGQELYQIDFEGAHSKWQASARFLLSLDKRYSSNQKNQFTLSALGSELYLSSATSCDQLMLWPDDPKKLRDMWLARQNDEEIFESLTNTLLAAGHFEEYKELITLSRRAMSKLLPCLTTVVGQGLNLQLQGKDKEARWIYDQVITLGAEAGPVPLFIRDCLKGEDPKLNDLVFDLGHLHLVGTRSLKLALWQFAGFSEKLPEHLKEYSSFVVQKKQEKENEGQWQRAHEVANGMEIRGLLSENIALGISGQHYYDMSKRQMVRMDAYLRTWSKTRMYFMVGEVLIARQFNNGDLKELWRFDFKQEGLKNKKFESLWAGLRNPKSEFIANDPFLLIRVGSQLICMDGETGDLLWQKDFSRQLFPDSFRMDGRYLYFASARAKLSATVSIVAGNSPQAWIPERIDRVCKLDLLTGATVWRCPLDAPRVSPLDWDPRGRLVRQPHKVQLNFTANHYVVFSEDRWQFIDKKTGKLDSRKSQSKMTNDFRFLKAGPLMLFEQQNKTALLTTALGGRVALRRLGNDASQDGDSFATVGDKLYVFVSKRLSKKKVSDRVYVYDIDGGCLVEAFTIHFEGLNETDHLISSVTVMGQDLYISVKSGNVRYRNRVSGLRARRASVFRYNLDSGEMEKIADNVLRVTKQGPFVHISGSPVKKTYYYRRKDGNLEKNR